MVLARMTIWKLKPGKLGRGINALYETLTGLARSEKGFLGSVSLLCQDDENTVTTVSMWETGEARADSDRFFKKAYETLTESPWVFQKLGNFEYIPLNLR